MATKKKNTKTPSNLTTKQKRNFFLIFWGLFAAGVSSVVLIFVLIANGAIGYLPPLEELQNPKNPAELIDTKVIKFIVE
jgi:penicillin-binding protein 1A